MCLLQPLWVIWQAQLVRRPSRPLRSINDQYTINALYYSSSYYVILKWLLTAPISRLSWTKPRICSSWIFTFGRSQETAFLWYWSSTSHMSPKSLMVRVAFADLIHDAVSLTLVTDCTSIWSSLWIGWWFTYRWESLLFQEKNDGACLCLFHPLFNFPLWWKVHTVLQLVVDYISVVPLVFR